MDKNKLLESAIALEKKAQEMFDEAKKNRELMLLDTEEEDFNDWIKLSSIKREIRSSPRRWKFLTPNTFNSQCDLYCDYNNVYYWKMKGSYNNIERDWIVPIRAYEHIRDSESPWKTYLGWKKFCEKAKEVFENYEEAEYATIRGGKKVRISAWIKKPYCYNETTIYGADINIGNCFLRDIDIDTRNIVDLERHLYVISRKEIMGEE